MNTWIKRSDREPTKDETPVMYGRYKGEEWLETSAQYGWPASLNIEYNYWRSIKVPPPPRELTQRELDNQMVLEACAKGHLTYAVNDADLRSAREAIYAERREINGWLNAFFGNQWDENQQMLSLLANSAPASTNREVGCECVNTANPCRCASGDEGNKRRVHR